MSEASAAKHEIDRRARWEKAAIEPASEPSALDAIVEAGGLGSDAPSRQRGRELVKEFIVQVLEGAMTASRDVTAAINSRLAQIDHLISLQLNEVLHERKFQELEAAWRGLKYLVNRVEPGKDVKVRVLNATKTELLRDFWEAEEKSDSALYRALVLDGSETLGEEPFSALLGNYSFGNNPEEIELLERLGRIGSIALTPVLAGASPHMLQLLSFAGGLGGAPGRLSRTFAATSFAKWNAFRRSADGEFVTLLLPAVLLRKPYGQNGTACEAFHYEEGVDGTDHSKFLWGNPVWAAGAQLGRAFQMGSWCGDPGAATGGGVIRRLPRFEFYNDDGQIAHKGPTEAQVSDSEYLDLTKHGFAPICVDAGGTRAVVYDLATAAHRPDYEDDDAELRESPPVFLRDVLIKCRVAQYLRCLVREKRNDLHTVADVETYLNRWLARYTVPEAISAGPGDRRGLFCEAHVQIVPEERGPKGWHRVVGYVVPNTGDSPAAEPIEISVKVLLGASISESGSGRNRPRLMDEASAPARISGAAERTGDPFSAASEALERVVDLKRRGVLDERDYLGLKNSIVANMKKLAGVSGESAPLKTEIPDIGSGGFPFAQLHAQIVDMIAGPDGAADPNTRAKNALRQMDAMGALNTGDAALLDQLVDAALGDDQNKTPSGLLHGVSEVAAEVRAHAASAACRAIAETAEHSGKRAIERGQERKHADGRWLSTLWRELVWPDVEGAFSGGAAAVAMNPVLAAHQFALPIQAIAAFGVVIGAGTRSGAAYAAHKAQSVPVEA